jgi:hypothetical protein
MKPCSKSLKILIENEGTYLAKQNTLTTKDENVFKNGYLISHLGTRMVIQYNEGHLFK